MNLISKGKKGTSARSARTGALEITVADELIAIRINAWCIFLTPLPIWLTVWVYANQYALAKACLLVFGVFLPRRPRLPAVIRPFA